MTPDNLAADVAAVVDARLAQRLADAQRRRETQRAERARRTAARAAGVDIRNARKLARLAGDPMRRMDPMQPSGKRATP